MAAAISRRDRLGAFDAQRVAVGPHESAFVRRPEAALRSACLCLRQHRNERHCPARRSSVSTCEGAFPVSRSVPPARRLRVAMQRAIERQRQAACHRTPWWSCAPRSPGPAPRRTPRGNISRAADAVGDARQSPCPDPVRGDTVRFPRGCSIDSEIAERPVRLVVWALHLVADVVGGDVILAFRGPGGGLRAGAAWPRDCSIRAGAPDHSVSSFSCRRSIVHAAEDHGAQASVADGQGIGPFVGGLTEPQHRPRYGRLGRRALESAGGQHSRGQFCEFASGPVHDGIGLS